MIPEFVAKWIELEEALKVAYEKINGRKGEMVDGTYVKEGDL